MANLSITRFVATSNTSVRVEFSAPINTLINKYNIEISTTYAGVPIPEILDVNIAEDLLDIIIQPMTPLIPYIFKFINTGILFSSADNTQFLPIDGFNNKISINGPEEPTNSVKQFFLDYLKDNIYNLDGTNLVSSIINSQSRYLSGALHDIGQAANDNYLEVLIENERQIRGEGPYDRLNQEGAFEVVRVGLTQAGTNQSLSFTYNPFPKDIITLQRSDIVSEIITPGNGYDNLIITVAHKPVTKLTNLVIQYFSGPVVTYNIATMGYQLSNSNYDTAYASTLVTLEENQIKISDLVLDDPSFVLPQVGDILYVSYQYKDLGRVIDANSVMVSNIINVVREPTPAITNQFSLQFAPIVTLSDVIPTLSGVVFLDPSANPPFSLVHPAFTTEIEFNVDSFPKTPGEYSIDYSSGAVFVYGATINDGTGDFPPTATYSYRFVYNNSLDYTFNSETYDLAASPLRELIGQSAKTSFNYEKVLVPGVDYVAQVHKEVINERIENRLTTLASLVVKNLPITNVFRVYNETSGEIYTINRFSDITGTVYFSSNNPPRIIESLRERARFADILNEIMLVNTTLTNVSSVRIYKVLLSNQNIIASTEDSIGSKFNSSVSFSRNDLFINEKYFDGQAVSLSVNLNKLSIGDYLVDYKNGIVYVGVTNILGLDIGTINYKAPAILTNNSHIISVSKIYNSVNVSSTISKNINYDSFNDTEILPSSFVLSDERFLNGNIAYPYLYTSGTITVSDNVNYVRHIYDLHDLNNNAAPIDFSPIATASGTLITINPIGINKQESSVINIDALSITATFISSGININSVTSVVRVSDGAQLWNSTGSFAGNTITLPVQGGLVAGQQVIINYNVILNGGSTPVVDYDRGDYFVDYTYLADEILVSYEYGDNQLDYRQSNSLDVGTEYFVTYKVGALRDALLQNFGTLVDLPIVNSFDTSLNRESYRNALQGALQSFTKGPTLPAMKLLVSSITKIDPEIIESAFNVWSLGISNLYPKGIAYTGRPQLLEGKFDQGVFLNLGDTITLPISSNLRLEEGSLETWIIPEWNGIDNDATLTFNYLNKNNIPLSLNNIFIGAKSYNPTSIPFSVNKTDVNDPTGLPAAIFTHNGIFIYFDSSANRWNVLAKDIKADGYQYAGQITTDGEFYNTQFVQTAGMSNDSLRTMTNSVEFILNIDSSDPDGYQAGDSFDGVAFMSDRRHYIFDFGKEVARNRFSLYKDGKGYLNFEVMDNGRYFEPRKYKVSSDISSWLAGQKHHIGIAWKINNYDGRDELHLFIDGFEVPNILRFGGRPIAASTDRFRTVKPEIVAGTFPKNVIQGHDLVTTLGNNVVHSAAADFTGINIGDTIIINEIGFTSYTINNIAGQYLTLSSPMPATLPNAAFSINEYSIVVASEIDLEANIAVSILHSGQETEIPGLRATYPAYSISKNGQLQNVLTILGDASAGDQIYIRTLGLNHRRCRSNIYLWGSTNVIKTQMPSPVNLAEVKIYSVILPLVSVGPSNSSIVGPTFVSNALVPTSTSNIAEGRTLAIRVTGSNVDFSTPVSVVITGTSSGPGTEILSFSSATTQNTANKWKTISSVVVTVKPTSLLSNSTAIEIKEAYSATYSEGNSNYPVIRFSYQTAYGQNLTSDGLGTISGGFFHSSDVGNAIVVTSPISAMATIAGFINSTTVTVTPALSSFTGGIYNLYNVTNSRSGFQNGFFTFELAGNAGTAYNLPKGQYQFDYSAYLTIYFDNLSNELGYIGTDFNGNNSANAVIDEFRILSRQITDTRIGESLAIGQKSFTADAQALRPFDVDSDTLALLHFDQAPFINDALFYKIATAQFMQSGSSVNGSFGDSLIVTDYPYTLDNKGILSESEGTIEFWVSPNYDTYNDPNDRYYFDAAAGAIETVTSLSLDTVKIGGKASHIVSVRLTTDTNGSGIDFMVDGSLGTDFQTITLGRALPAQQTPVVITYIPNGLLGNRLSVFKDSNGFLNFSVSSRGVYYNVRHPVFWSKNTWHRVMAIYKFNISNGTMRFFIDGDEALDVRFGQGEVFGQNIVYDQEGANAILMANIQFTDMINELFIGSAFNRINIANARFDNFKISNKAKIPLSVAGQPIDINYNSNNSVVLPVVEDLYTTFIMNFEKILEKNEDFAILRDSRYGIFNFIINVIDSFDIIKDSAKLEQIMNEMILALKPAQSKVTINVVR